MATSDGVGTALARAAKTGVASLLLTALAIGGLTIVLAIVAPIIAGGGWRSGVAALCALAAGVAAIAFGAVKRAIGKGLGVVLEQAQLGSRLADLVFERLGGDTSTPLALPDATTRLHAAVSAVATSKLANRWLARRIGGNALAMVQTVMSQRFVDESAKHGHVDLAVVREDVGLRIDGAVQERVADTVQTATILAVAIAVLGALVPAVLMRFV